MGEVGRRVHAHQDEVVALRERRSRGPSVAAGSRRPGRGRTCVPRPRSGSRLGRERVERIAGAVPGIRCAPRRSRSPSARAPRAAPELSEHGAGDERTLRARGERPEVHDQAAVSGSSRSLSIDASSRDRPDLLLTPRLRARSRAGEPRRTATTRGPRSSRMFASSTIAVSSAYSSRSATGSSRNSAAWLRAGSRSRKWSRAATRRSFRSHDDVPGRLGVALRRAGSAPVAGSPTARRSPSSGSSTRRARSFPSAAAPAARRRSTSFRSPTARRGACGGQSRRRRVRTARPAPAPAHRRRACALGAPLEPRLDLCPHGGAHVGVVERAPVDRRAPHRGPAGPDQDLPAAVRAPSDPRASPATAPGRAASPHPSRARRNRPLPGSSPWSAAWNTNRRPSTEVASGSTEASSGVANTAVLLDCRATSLMRRPSQRHTTRESSDSGDAGEPRTPERVGRVKRRRRGLVIGLLILATVCGLVGIFVAVGQPADAQPEERDRGLHEPARGRGDPEAGRRLRGRRSCSPTSTSRTQIEAALPAQLKGLSGPAAGALRQVAEREAPRVLASPHVQLLWRQANLDDATAAARGGQWRTATRSRRRTAR